LPQFSAACRRILAEDPGPAGRNKICLLLQDVLRDESFVAAHLTDDTPERQIIYEDKELGFCILAHAYQGAKASAPHDHGPSWAIYGQARGETEMSDWTLVAPASADKPGKVLHSRTYTLRPGHGPRLQRGRPALAHTRWRERYQPFPLRGKGDL
jgi:hypothetical protein